MGGGGGEQGHLPPPWKASLKAYSSCNGKRSLKLLLSNSYCVWLLNMNFCKMLFHIILLSLEITVYDVAVLLFRLL